MRHSVMSFHLHIQLCNHHTEHGLSFLRLCVLLREWTAAGQATMAAGIPIQRLLQSSGSCDGA